jgi:hypothetical protein
MLVKIAARIDVLKRVLKHQKSFTPEFLKVQAKKAKSKMLENYRLEPGKLSDSQAWDIFNRQVYHNVRNVGRRVTNPIRYDKGVDRMGNAAAFLKGKGKEIAEGGKKAVDYLKKNKAEASIVAGSTIIGGVGAKKAIDHLRKKKESK